MKLSRILYSLSVPPVSCMKDLLELNKKTAIFDLKLTPKDIHQLMTERNRILHSYGRLELGIGVTKELIEVFAGSPYICSDNYLVTLNELHEIFYYLKNETEDKVSDFELIGMMKDFFNNDCAGSLELLRSKLEGYAMEFRVESMRVEFLREKGDE